MRQPITTLLVFVVLLGVNLVGEDHDGSAPTNTDTLQNQRDQNYRLDEVTDRLQDLEEQLERTQNLVDALIQELPSRQSSYIQDAFSSFSMNQDDATKGFIGVYLDRATENGVPITRVVESSPADVARFEAGDVILNVNGIDIFQQDNPVASTIELINSNPPDSTIQITILRNGQEVTLSVATARRSSIAFEENDSIARSSILRNLNDLTSRINAFVVESRKFRNTIHVMEIDEDFGRYFGVEKGVLVLAADEIEDIQAGDILLKINDQTIESSSQTLRLNQASDDKVTILIKRDNQEKRVTLNKDQFTIRSLLD